MKANLKHFKTFYECVDTFFFRSIRNFVDK